MSGFVGIFSSSATGPWKELAGIMRVNAIVRNPADLDRSWEGTFLVDTGAIDCVIPRQHLEAIGLTPLDSRVYGLADGSEIRMDVTVGVLELMGGRTGKDIVIVDDEGAEPLLGATVLESLGIEIDARNEQLTKLPSTRMRAIRPATDLSPT
jgi:clan AA aspartic protease